jgi:hypothetical protein
LTDGRTVIEKGDEHRILSGLPLGLVGSLDVISEPTPRIFGEAGAVTGLQVG